MIPLFIFPKDFSVAYNDETVFGASDTHINPFAVTDKRARICAYHRNKDDVELSTLRAVDCKHLIFNLIFSEILSDCVFLGIVRSDHVDIILGKFHFWNLSVDTVFKSLELLHTKVFELIDNFCLCLVFEGSALLVFYSVRYVDKKEGGIREHKSLIILELVATHNFSIVKESVGHI